MHETPVCMSMKALEALQDKKASKFVVKTPTETDIQVLARKTARRNPRKPRPRKLNFKKTRKVSFSCAEI